MRNRLKYWRHQLLFDRQKDFAEWLEVSAYSLNRWEAQATQPDLSSLWKIYKRIKEKFPEIHIEDLLEEAPE